MAYCTKFNYSLEVHTSYVFQHSRRVVAYCTDIDKQQFSRPCRHARRYSKTKTRRVLLSGSVCLSQVSERHACYSRDNRSLVAELFVKLPLIRPIDGSKMRRRKQLYGYQVDRCTLHWLTMGRDLSGSFYFYLSYPTAVSAE